MTTSSPPPGRRLVVEVVSARDLLPKDGLGTSSPYVIVDFDGQKLRTSTKERDLNPVWNETLEFMVSDPENMEEEDLELEVFTDRRTSGSSGPKRRQSLGKLKILGTQFSKQGAENLIYYSLQKKSVFSWIRGEIGLKIYHYDVIPEDREVAELRKSPIHVVEEKQETLAEEIVHGESIVVQESPPKINKLNPVAELTPSEEHYNSNIRVRSTRRQEGEFLPSRCERERATQCELVEPIQYLFVRVVKARNLNQNEDAYVKIQTTGHSIRSKPASSNHPEWKQVFALCYNRAESSNSVLEVSVYDSGSNRFLGGVCFHVPDIPVRDLPDSPLAPQWYRLEGEEGVSGDIQVSVWIGTQADDAFPESLSSDAPYIAYTRPKVYHSPKLWYLRVTVIEAQDLHVRTGSSSLDIRVRAQLGFQCRRSRRGSVNNNTASFLWLEDFIFVAGGGGGGGDGDLLDERLIVAVEDCTGHDPVVLGETSVGLKSIDQRLDERHVTAKWFGLEKSGSGGSYYGRIYLRPCLEGGFHVIDESVHACSDYRPTATQLWKPPVGILEVGILRAHALPAMKTKPDGSRSTDSYCVAKYGYKWIRTRTIMDSFDPRWNEQYTWQVYDPCTVLTIGVFDNCRIFDRPDNPVGKIRIRVSTLESNKIYRTSYPLLVLLRTGLRKMGEIELAVRFACPGLLMEACGLYAHPLLPRMHYLRPLGVTQQDALRAAARKMIAAWLARSEPPLRGEVVGFILDSDSHSWSMRKSKANWIRILEVFGWIIGLSKWLDDIRRWRSPLTTILVHMLYLVLVWYPDLIVPTAVLYVILVGIWYYRFRPGFPPGMDTRLSQAVGADLDELDEEFDPIPSAKAPEIVRQRYDRVRILASRIQKLLGDLATQGERVHALVSWRDPRATRLFIAVCVVVTVVLYSVPPQIVAVALGFYLLRHPMFRDPMPSASLNFFRRLPSLSDRLI